MEIRARSIILLLLAALGIAGALFLLPALPARPLDLFPAFRATAVPALPVPVTPAGDVDQPGTLSPAITFQDDSLGWDWTVTCAPQLRQFLAENLAHQPIKAVSVTLADATPDRSLPFGVRYPDPAGAQANANCYHMGDDRYSCYVTVTAGEPGPDLDVAMTLAAPYALLDMFLARGSEPDVLRRTWRWSTFQPLLAPIPDTDNRWRSTCLQISRVQ